MNYIAKLQPDNSGNITNGRNYSRLTANDFADWIGDRLNGRIQIVPYHPRDDLRIPEMIFTDLLQNLPEKQKNTLQRGIDICVDEAYEECKKQKRKQWNTESFDDLMIFVDIAIYDGNYQPPAEKFTSFLDYLSPVEKVKENRTGNYQRVLAVLTELNMPLSFWEEQLQKAPRRNAGVCLWGAYNLSPYDALSLLTQMDWSDVEDAEQLLGFGIVLLLDTCAKDKELETAYQETKRKLNKHAREVLEKKEKEIR